VGGLLIRNGISSVLHTEGGHAGFAPVTAREIAILQRLQARFGRVSNERLVSGQGLANLHWASCEIDAVAAPTLSPEQIIAGADNDPACARTIATFCEIYGAIAGDLVLGFGAWDGVYLAGGLTSALLPWLERGGFRHRFEEKGRFCRAMAQVPTVVMTHPHAGLLGAAAIAVRDAGQ
jgi:glucokinase